MRKKFIGKAMALFIVFCLVIPFGGCEKSNNTSSRKSEGAIEGSTNDKVKDITEDNSSIENSTNKDSTASNTVSKSEKNTSSTTKQTNSKTNTSSKNNTSSTVNSTTQSTSSNDTTSKGLTSDVPDYTILPEYCSFCGKKIMLTKDWIKSGFDERYCDGGCGISWGTGN